MTKRDDTLEVFDKLRHTKPSRPLVVGELLDHLMSIWGGPRQFATAFFEEFNRAPKGGTARTRMLGDVMRLFMFQTGMLKTNTTPVEAMTDAELQDALRAYLHVDNGSAPSRGKGGGSGSSWGSVEAAE